MPFRRNDDGWRWRGAALCLWSLAPSLAPRSLVSNANVPNPGDAAGGRGGIGENRRDLLAMACRWTCAATVTPISPPATVGRK